MDDLCYVLLILCLLMLLKSLFLKCFILCVFVTDAVIGVYIEEVLEQLQCIMLKYTWEP